MNHDSNNAHAVHGSIQYALYRYLLSWLRTTEYAKLYLKFEGALNRKELHILMQTQWKSNRQRLNM